jgi:hypothetical protein
MGVLVVDKDGRPIMAPLFSLSLSLSLALSFFKFFLEYAVKKKIDTNKKHGTNFIYKKKC